MPTEIGGAANLAVSGLQIANQTQANLGAAIVQGLENAQAVAESAGGTPAEAEQPAATPPAPPSESGRGQNLDISV